jgi:hypothetical protein
MDKNRIEFDTEGQAIAFCEGFEAGGEHMLEQLRGPYYAPTCERFVEGDHWVVIFE